MYSALTNKLQQYNACCRNVILSSLWTIWGKGDWHLIILEEMSIYSPKTVETFRANLVIITSHVHETTHLIYVCYKYIQVYVYDWRLPFIKFYN